MNKHKVFGETKPIWFLGLVFIVLFALTHILLCATEYFRSATHQLATQLTDINKGIAAQGEDKGFQCEITDNVMISETPFGDSNLSFAMFHLYVFNSGSESIARKWKCAAKIGGTPVISEASQYPLSITFTNIPNTPQNKTLFWDNGRYLPNALSETPLIRGAGKQGWVLFKFPLKLLDDLHVKGGVEVHFQQQSCWITTKVRADKTSQRAGVEYTVEFEDKAHRTTTVQWVVPAGYGKP